MNKKEFRQKQKQILTNFAQTSEKKKEDQILFERIINSDIIRKSQTIGVTASMPIEIDTSKIVSALWDLGKQVYLAKAYPGKDRRQDFLRYTCNSALERSKFGVLEIAEDTEINNNLDLLIVPGLAFAADSHARLGFGGGYYDRFLAKHPKTHTVSLVNSKMLFKKAEWPLEATDIPVQEIITVKK